MIGIEIIMRQVISSSIKLYTDYSIDMTVIGNFEKLIESIYHKLNTLKKFILFITMKQLSI